MINKVIAMLFSGLIFLFIVVTGLWIVVAMFIAIFIAIVLFIAGVLSVLDVFDKDLK